MASTPNPTVTITVTPPAHPLGTAARRLYDAAADMARADSDDAVHVADIELEQAQRGFFAAGGSAETADQIRDAAYLVAECYALCAAAEQAVAAR